MRGTGHAVVLASATGRLSDPSISGYADVEDGSFRYRALPRSFTNLSGRVTFDGNAVNLNPSSCPAGQTQCGLRGKFGDGDVVFGGSVSLKQYLPDRFDLTAQGTAMRLRYPEGFSSTVNADLTLTGPVASPLLAGRVDVLYASYNKTIDTDAGIVALAAAAGAGPVTLTGEAGGPLAESGYPLSFNIDIRANRTLHIDNKRTATIVGSADLSYRGTLDRPSLTGHIDIDSGEVFINGNRFKLLPSTIQFSNPARLDPYFDIMAETHPRAGGETFNIGVHVTGALHAAPTVSFTSDPYLNQVDILTLILGGIPDVGSAEQRSLQSQQQAYTMLMQTAAAQLLLSPLSSRVGNVFEKTNLLDTMQVTTVLPNENSFQQLSPSTRVTIGKRLSPRLYLTYARDLNSSQYKVILVEYRAERSYFVDPLPQRGSNVRARFPDPARLLMPGRRILALALVLAAAAATPARAQDIDHYLGLTVTAVRFEVDGKPDTAGTLQSLVDVKPGEPLRLQAVRSSIQRLVSVGNFDPDVTVDAFDANGGVALLFKVGARHPVDQLQFTNDTGLDPKELRNRVNDQYGGLPANVPPGKVAQTVREILNDEGYLNADVAVSVVKRNNPDRATLVFDVAAGDRAIITAVVVRNNARSVFSNEALVNRTGLVVGRPYRYGDTSRALAAIRDDLTGAQVLRRGRLARAGRLGRPQVRRRDTHGGCGPARGGAVDRRPAAGRQPGGSRPDRARAGGGRRPAG